MTKPHNSAHEGRVILLLTVRLVAGQPRTTGYILPLSAPLVNRESASSRVRECVCACVLQPEPAPRSARLSPHCIPFVGTAVVQWIRAIWLVWITGFSAA